MYILERFIILNISAPGPGATTVPFSLKTSSIIPEKGALIVNLPNCFLSCLVAFFCESYEVLACKYCISEPIC